MESVDMHKILHQLVDTWESEVVEFKEASKDYKTPEIYRYFSALSNEANLRGVKSAWLVFGVRNKDKQIVGTDFRLQHDQLHNLKQQVKQSTGSISFREICQLPRPKRPRLAKAWLTSLSLPKGDYVGWEYRHRRMLLLVRRAAVSR